MTTRRKSGITTRERPKKPKGLKVKVIIHAAEEGGYWAEVPALPGCVTEGDTRADCTRTAKLTFTWTAWLCHRRRHAGGAIGQLAGSHRGLLAGDPWLVSP
jgi:hypothetical protein